MYPASSATLQIQFDEREQEERANLVVLLFVSVMR